MPQILPFRFPVLLLLLSCRPAEGPEGEVEGLAPTGWWDRARSGIETDARAFRAVGSAFDADSPAQHLHTRIDARGARLRAGEDSVRVDLAAWGREGSLLAREAVAPELGDCTEEAGVQGRCVRRVEQRGEDGVTAWWANRDDGLEQGFSVEDAPDGDGELVLAVAIRGASVDVDEDGATAWLFGDAGETVRVDGLAAWDSEGTVLPATFAFGDDGFEIRVDDADAVYPIEIDPIYSTASTTLTGTASSGYFGFSVANAGDVDNDGYTDVIVGAYNAGSSMGSVYVFHGSASGLSTTAATTLSGATTGYAFGYSVASAGDVNNDGYGDVIIGAPQYSSSKGTAYVYHGSAAGVSSSATSTLTTGFNAYMGASVAGAGDVNGDGYDDVAVGEPNTAGYSGRVEVFHGSASGVSTTATTTLNGPSSSSYFGWSVAGAGDVNKDGYSDLIVGAYGYSSSTGRAEVHHGSASGISTSISTTLSGPSTSSYFGYAVAGLGDVNNDGYSDVAVGAYGYSSSTGRVSVYHGSSSGVSSTATSNLSGPGSSAYFGRAIGAAGDINADGYDDIVVGAPNYTAYGGAYLYQGSSSGISTTASTSLTGGTSGAQFGAAVSGVGDINDDGYGDVIIGSPNYSSNTGKADIYQGYADNDSDGYSGTEDCDDSDAAIYPGATELCDGADNNCDGTTDEATAADAVTVYRDADEDGFGDESVTSVGCSAPDGYAEASDLGFDCDDTNTSIYPLAAEISSDGIDQDCDGGDSCYVDADGDGYRDDLGTSVVSEDLDCADSGEAADTMPAGDCDDAEAATYPDADEVVGDEIDQSCDGTETCYADDDGDGYRPDSTTTVDSSDTDCQDEGEADEATLSNDCDDGDPTLSPGQPEIVDDGLDQNCDDGDSCYPDADSDGYRPNASSPIDSEDLDCDDAGESHISVSTGDCDDADATVSPGVTETCDGLDNNCDNLVDIVIPTSGPGAYYEISVCDDSDDDGLLDYTERTVYETDPSLADSDGDGVADGTELGLDSPEDPDATTTANFQEDEDPSTTTNPLNDDSDDDTLTDGEEDVNANGAVDEEETDPNLADTDGGGVSDAIEIQKGTDPLDPLDDGGDSGGGDDTDSGGTTDTSTDDGKDKGCGCSSAAGPRGSALVVLGLLALIPLRRRHRHI